MSGGRRWRSFFVSVADALNYFLCPAVTVRLSTRDGG